MSDNSKLKQFCEAVESTYADLCRHGGDECAEAWHKAETEFADAASPEAVLGLLAEIEEWKAKYAECAEFIDEATIEHVDIDDLSREAEFYKQVQRGAGELPEGWEILIRIERDAGNAELIDPEGNEVDYPSNHECLADSISDAIDEALSLAGVATK
jgi:hypothetical protein